jgi:RNA polymerase sigma-70 factor (sigma-E family)
MKRRGAVTFDQFASPRLNSWLKMSTALCRDPLLAEDLLQDVLIKVHRHWQRIRSLDSPDAYVHRMITNEFLSSRRRWLRRRSSNELPDLASDSDHATEVVDRDALLREIGKLPRKQRAVLILRYYCGMTDLEIAESLGCSGGTVRGYASRALATLRIEPAASLIRAEGN